MTTRAASGDDVAIGWRVLDAVIAARRRIGRRGRRLTSALMVLPGVALVSVLVAGVVLLAWRSVHAFDPFMFQQGPLSLENYREIVETPLHREIFLRTLMMAAITTVIAIAVALPVAYVMSRVRSRALRLLILVVIFMPILTGDIARAYGWLVLLGREGMIPWVLDAAGLARPAILGTLWAVGIGTVQILVPLCVVILLPAFQRIDASLEQAAATLGAGPVRTWTRVILPLVRPGIAGAAAVALTISMTEFATPTLLGLGVRDYVANLVQSIVLGRDNVYLGSALGILLLVAVMIMVSVVIVLGQRSRARSSADRVAGGRR